MANQKRRSHSGLPRQRRAAIARADSRARVMRRLPMPRAANDNADPRAQSLGARMLYVILACAILAAILALTTG